MSETPFDTSYAPQAETDASIQQMPEELIQPILDSLAKGNSKRPEGFIGEGADKMAFLIAPTEGQHDPRVLKIIKRPEKPLSPEEEAAYVRQKTLASTTPLEIGKGVDGLEQLLAFDPARGLIMTTYMPGKTISTIGSKDLLAIKDRHLLKLKQMLQQMKERHLHPHNTGGILFDKDKGFSFVDYESDSAEKFNRGSIDSLEEFLHFALADLNKLDALAAQKMAGINVPDKMFKTTGSRALVRGIILRRARKLKS